MVFMTLSVEAFFVGFVLLGFEDDIFELWQLDTYWRHMCILLSLIAHT